MKKKTFQIIRYFINFIFELHLIEEKYKYLLFVYIYCKAGHSFGLI